VLILLGLAGIAATLADGSWNDAARLGGWFAGGLAVSLALLAGVAWLLLRGLRVLQRNSRWALPASVRHGIANLYRPGNQAAAVLTALGVGVMFTLTVYLVQHSMLGQIRRSAPPGMPNVFLIDIQASQKDAVVETLKTAPGVGAPPEVFPSVSLRVTAVDGVPPGKLELKGFARRFLQPRSVTWAKARPEFTDIIQGEWVNERAGFVSVSEDAAKALRLKPGSVLDFLGSGRPLRATVSGVHKTESIRLGASVEFIFAPATLEGFPVIYYGGVRVAPAKVAELQRLSYSKFPTVTVINIADVLEIVQEVIDQISVVIRFISGFAILAGVVILASSVAGTRFRRIRETVILKTLGGTRPRIAGIFSVEFLVLGAVAGLMGSLLGLGFTRLIFSRFFEGEFEWNLPPAILAVVLTAVTANFAGWLASWRILGQKPLEVLREE
jgi:putative ABC transport system permease protein